jgi:hypothetical protein
MIQHARWSQWFKSEARHLYWSFRYQWNRWRMWQQPLRSEAFRARLRKILELKRREGE